MVCSRGRGSGPRHRVSPHRPRSVRARRVFSLQASHFAKRNSGATTGASRTTVANSKPPRSRDHDDAGRGQTGLVDNPSSGGHTRGGDAVKCRGKRRDRRSPPRRIEVALSRSRTHGFSPDRFRQARLRGRLTQEDIAIAAGLHAATIGHWETGRSTPGPRELGRAAAIMGKAVEDFLSTPPGSRSLAQLRQQAGYTQADLARLLGCPVTTWGPMELGKQRIGHERLTTVAALLDTDPDTVRAAWQRTVDKRDLPSIGETEHSAASHRAPAARAASRKVMGGSPWAPVGSRSLAELRLQAAYTQAELAELLSMTRRNWGAIELGKRRIADDRLTAVAALLDTDPNTVRSAWQTTFEARQHATSGGATRQDTASTGSGEQTPLGSRLLPELRQQVGDSQADLARLLSLPRTTWGSMERGARRIEGDRLAAVAALLDTDPDTVRAAWERTVDRRQQHARRMG